MKRLIRVMAIACLCCSANRAQAAHNAPTVSPDASANPQSGPTADAQKLDSHGAPELNVEFKIDSYEILPNFKPTLNAFGRYLKENPESTAEIVGHSDGTGHGPQNGELAQKRANAVFAYLVSAYGIDALRIKAYGAASSTDKMSNITAAARQHERQAIGRILVAPANK